MTEAEGPAALPWSEKVERIVAVLAEHRGSDPSDERLAERILNAIGDANE